MNELNHRPVQLVLKDCERQFCLIADNNWWRIAYS